MILAKISETSLILFIFRFVKNKFFAMRASKTILDFFLWIFQPYSTFPTSAIDKYVIVIHVTWAKTLFSFLGFQNTASREPASLRCRITVDR